MMRLLSSRRGLAAVFAAIFVGWVLHRAWTAPPVPAQKPIKAKLVRLGRPAEDAARRAAEDE